MSGTITYNGKPVNGAILHLHPSGEGTTGVNVPVTQEGTFNTSDIPPGEYKIVVEGKKPPAQMVEKMTKFPKNMDPAKKAAMEKSRDEVFGKEAPTIAFPNKYKKVETSDLKCTISQGKKENLSLELKD
ncbi:MAG TPA: hypothetical protein VH592_12770 [Gemmataceae bacterium]